MTVLVTGGAGYIGTHVVRLLQVQGTPVVVVDDLSTGDAGRLKDVPLIQFDIATDGAVDVLTRTFTSYDVDAVIHFASKKEVGKSVFVPAFYYRQNVGGMANLLLAMEAAGVDKLVFSSSAATYGSPDVPVVTEDMMGPAVCPYGETKVVGEWMGRDAVRAWGLRFVALRYFNVAGAGAPELGDPAILNLIPLVFDRLSKGERPQIFGDDYPTPDGTCIRDYVHVADLAQAHLTALDYLDRPDAQRPADAFNVGTGAGSSVKEVIAEIGRATGLDVTADTVGRRAGDPACLICATDLIKSELGWEAQKTLPEMVSSAWQAWQWQRNHISA